MLKKWWYNIVLYFTALAKETEEFEPYGSVTLVGVFVLSVFFPSVSVAFLFVVLLLYAYLKLRG